MNETNTDFSTRLGESFTTTGIVWLVIGFIMAVVFSVLYYESELSKRDRRIQELVEKNSTLERQNEALSSSVDTEPRIVNYQVVGFVEREPVASLVIATAVQLQVIST